jgi:dephospho-CoA kinase
MENGNKIDAKTKIVLQRFMERCDSDEPFEDTHGIKYPNYKEYKKDCVKILLYNNHEQITKDIASLLDDCEPSTPNL